MTATTATTATAPATAPAAVTAVPRRAPAGGGAAEGAGGGAAAPASAAGAPDPGAARAREALEQAIIGKAVGLVSGPGGLASFLRRRQLGARLGGPSLPLDVGVSSDIPAAIRRAVILRDQHCRFPGGCDQPAAGCEVHHLTHKADGGKTSVKDCALVLLFPPPSRHPPVGLDRRAEPRRHHHRVEQGQDQGAAQPRAPGPARVTPPGPAGHGGTRISQAGTASDDARQGNRPAASSDVALGAGCGTRGRAVYPSVPHPLVSGVPSRPKDRPQPRTM